jgi:hypothetical protein
MPRMLAHAPVEVITLDVAPLPAAAPQPVERPVRWRLRTRIAFRLCFLYFTLYVVTTQMIAGLFLFSFLPFGGLPNLGATGYMKGLVTWTATNVFKVTSPFVTVNTGSGDKTIDWVQSFCLFVIAAVATALWSIADRRRDNHASLHKWFHLFLRFAVGSTMVSYGMVKAIPLQMPAPNLTRLLEPFGHFSPMGVLWYSIGASRGYEMFAGFVELTGGILLFVPRLRILGALVTLAASVQIFTLNMTYDVPVKLFAFHLILMSLVLLAPEAKRIMRVLVLNKTAEPSTQPPLFRGLRARRVMFAVQLLLGAYIIGMNFDTAHKAWFSRGGGAPKPPLYGIWNVDEMKVDGVVRSPVVNDYGRWRRVIIQNSATMSFQRMDDTFQGYSATVDMTAKTVALTSAADKAFAAKFAIEQQEPERMVLDGTMNGQKVRLQLQRFDHTKLQLLSRGFNWIQERPFNR